MSHTRACVHLQAKAMTSSFQPTIHPYFMSGECKVMFDFNLQSSLGLVIKEYIDKQFYTLIRAKLKRWTFSGLHLSSRKKQLFLSQTWMRSVSVMNITSSSRRSGHVHLTCRVMLVITNVYRSIHFYTPWMYCKTAHVLKALIKV